MHNESTSTPTSTDLSVIVCAYTQERWDDIVEVIESIKNQQSAVGEIVLVVDHNEDLYQQATGFFEGITIVANKHKRGLSGARNTGIESSKKEIIAFIDDDAVVAPNWSDTQITPYADKTVAGVGGAIEPLWQVTKPAWWPDEFGWIVGCSYKGLPTKTQQVRNPIGANMSVRRSAFDVVGGFSSAIGRVGKHPVGCEETELFIRIRQHWPESKIIYEPTSTVGHKVTAERATFTYFRRRCFAEGLSKAVVAQLVGADDGLSSEWSYTLKTLPLGALRGVGSGVRGNVSGFKQAGAIIAGLAITTAGYLRGRLNKGPSRNLVTVPTNEAA